MDQNRQENTPSQHTLQVHVHFLCCPCSNVMYPYYPPGGYRPPILLQPPPIPRPSYLHHYQYTQLHLNPAYNVPLPSSTSQPLPPTMNQQSTAEIAFEPPPRDRRILEKCDEPRFLTEDKMDNQTVIHFPPLNEAGGAIMSIGHLQGLFKNLTATQVASLTTENYIKYLENGCFIGETIAKKNEQRPCFKNIQNLCNRTRTEVMKPNITVSNIHSQGVPWATKDFIFAFVRAINCWCILRGYLGSKDGNLGKIEREISNEFRECYVNWEKCTKQLTHHLIHTFHNLDEANSSSNYLGPSTSIVRSKYSPPTVEQQRKPPAEPQTLSEIKNKEAAPNKKIPGILHIPSTSSTEIGEVCNPTSESPEVSPRDEDSDNERRIYMKPGSYNVPTKNRNSSPSGTSPKRIEFFNKARNVKSRSRKTDNSESYNSDDQIWQTAQSVTPDFIKQHEQSPFNNSVKKIYDMSLMQPNNQIESWLNNELNIFGYISHDVDNEPLTQSDNWQLNSDKSKAVRDSDCEVTPRPFHTAPIGKEYSMLCKNNWEFKNGGLTNAARDVFENIFKEVEDTDFAKNFNSLGIHLTDSLTNPPDLAVIIKKLKTKLYCYVNEVVHDFRYFICFAYELFAHDRYVLKQIAVAQDVFENMLKQVYVGVDFSHIAGAPTDNSGPLVMKDRATSKRNTEGDGDH
ncbi:hypothetical protein FQR65_LT01435 [Abscondita terminalis]|nr:hypothetical protein FQR65_LT01435 [Abscondita terminalis]